MEALHGHLAPGEQTGAQHHPRPQSSPHLLISDPQPASPSSQQHHQTHETSQQPKPPGRRQHAERKRLRHQRQSVDSDAPPEVKHGGGDAKSTDRVPGPAAAAEAVPSASGPAQSKQEPEPQEGGTPKQKRERKPQRPGKYVCTYCGRACAKPSVLQKHIRSHTGERPYPCAPCGFSFKTKSNLYKHRKSHTHRVKAGLALGEPRSLDEAVTESEDESKQLSSASSIMEKQGSVASDRGHDADAPKGPPAASTDDSSSYAVKKRLAMRLSRGKQGPLGSSDEKSSSLILGSRGSTESGYFSRSESTEQSGDSPPNTTTSAKSYAEIILGKYGRLGQLHARMARNQDQQPSSGPEEKGVPFTVPKKQVIDHITKLITINEAVVDTSKIDSVKPRRFSLTRKSSNESQKGSSVKEQPVIHSPKPADPGYKNSGSITMGVPCEKFHHHHHHQQQSVNAEPPTSHTSTAPLLRSHSMPSAACTFDPSGGSPRRFRLSQSFDEQPSATQASRRYGMLRRQPAIEIPLEPPKEDYPSPLYRHDNVPDHMQSKPQPYECEACGTGCKDWDGYKAHKQRLCIAQHPLAASEVAVNQTDPRLPLANHPSRPAALAMRKRRKEESFEFDDPSVPVASSSPTSALSSAAPCRDECVVVNESSKRPPVVQTFSVIQHTSSFEKQEAPPCSEHQGTEPAKSSLCHEDQQALHHQKQTQQPTKPPPRKLVRQYNVQVPEILVTEDSTNPNTEPPSEQPTPASKPPLEKPEEFQWPQRSPTLAQLPIEKLPPKKKRLRLAEAAQSSGESSFDSVSLPPRSPSQDSSASYASSRSASFEESGRTDMAAAVAATTAAAAAAAAATPLRRSRAPHMLLTVPGLHQHREMRRSASEQAPHDPPHGGALTAENRSKSFDYSCLSPERTAVGWRDRRKCLLMRHSAVRDPDEVEEEQQEPMKRPVSPFPDPPVDHHPGTPTSRASPSSRHCSITMSASSPLTGDTLLPYNPNPSPSSRHEYFSQWKISQNMLVGNTPVHDRTIGPSKEEVPVPVPGPYAPQGPSGAARAHYLTVATGLKLEIPTQTQTQSTRTMMSESSGVRAGPRAGLGLPHITASAEVLRPAAAASPVAVAVRLHADTHAPACAIYTTMSQPQPQSPPGLQEPVCSSLSHHLTVPMDQGQVWSEEGPRSSGSGGNKRMLSPSNSIELHPETQQQQKRVKEEDGPKEGEDGESGEAAAADTSEKEEEDPGSGRVRSPVTRMGPPLLSMQANTCHSWCYLNYVKPNPSPSDEDKPSVYSSWSTATGYDPNPPGLSSKMALSLLHCKQRRLSPAIYTMSPMSPASPMSTTSVTQPTEPEDNQRPSSAEVHAVRSGVPTDEGRQSEQRHAPTHEGRRSARGHPPTDEGQRPEQRQAPTDEGQRSTRSHAPTDEGQWSAGSGGLMDLDSMEVSMSSMEARCTEKTSRSTSSQCVADALRACRSDVFGQNRSNSHEEEREEEEEKEEESGEELQTSSKHEPPPQVGACAGRSSERYGCTLARRGVKCECEGCGSSFPDALRKHTCPPAPRCTPCICKLCSFAGNAQGNPAKHVKSKAHEKCHKDVSCSLCRTHEGVCEERSVCPGDLSDLRHPGPHDSGRPTEDEENAIKGDEDGEQTTSSPPRRPTHPDGRSLQRGVLKCAAASAGARRGLFSRQRESSTTSRGPSSSSPPSLPCRRAPEDPASPRPERSPPRGLPSPGPRAPSDRSSPSSCHVSSSSSSSSVGRVSPGHDVRSQDATPAVCPSRDAHATETRDRRAERPTSKARLQRAASVLSPCDSSSGVLSHLPLHSRHAAPRSPSLMIPIGGLHMIQPRSTAPPYAPALTERPPPPPPRTPAAVPPPSPVPSSSTPRPPEEEEGGTEEEEEGSCWDARRRGSPPVPAEERRRRRRRRGGGSAALLQRRDPLKEVEEEKEEEEKEEEEEEEGAHSGALHQHRPYEVTPTTTTDHSLRKKKKKKKKRKKNAAGASGSGGGGAGHGSPPAAPAGEEEEEGGRRRRRRGGRRPAPPAPLRCQQQRDPLTEPAEEEEEVGGGRGGGGGGGGGTQSGQGSRRRHGANRGKTAAREEEETVPSPPLSPSGGEEPGKESNAAAAEAIRRSSFSSSLSPDRHRCCSRSDAKAASTLCQAAADARFTKKAVHPQTTAPSSSSSSSSSSRPQ